MRSTRAGVRQTPEGPHRETRRRMRGHQGRSGHTVRLRRRRSGQAGHHHANGDARRDQKGNASLTRPEAQHSAHTPAKPLRHSSVLPPRGRLPAPLPPLPGGSANKLTARQPTRNPTSVHPHAQSTTNLPEASSRRVSRSQSRHSGSAALPAQVTGPPSLSGPNAEPDDPTEHFHLQQTGRTMPMQTLVRAPAKPASPIACIGSRRPARTGRGRCSRALAIASTPGA